LLDYMADSDTQRMASSVMPQVVVFAVQHGRQRHHVATGMWSTRRPPPTH